MRISEDKAHRKRRINLTLDAPLVDLAKAMAHQQTTGKSRMVEKGLRSLLEKPEPPDSNFPERHLTAISKALMADTHTTGAFSMRSHASCAMLPTPIRRGQTQCR
jgi:hypothetical protein